MPGPNQKNSSNLIASTHLNHTHNAHQRDPTPAPLFLKPNTSSETRAPLKKTLSSRPLPPIQHIDSTPEPQKPTPDKKKQFKIAIVQTTVTVNASGHHLPPPKFLALWAPPPSNSALPIYKKQLHHCQDGFFWRRNAYYSDTSDENAEN